MYNFNKKYYYRVDLFTVVQEPCLNEWAKETKLISEESEKNAEQY